MGHQEYIAALNAPDAFLGKVVCITGAGSGIGKAAAEAFAKRGASLVLISRGENVKDIARGLGAISCLSFQGDVSDRKFVTSCAKETLRQFAGIDILINAAAILGPTLPLHETAIEDWEEVIRVDLIGVYLMMHEILPSMIRRRQGKIINFAGGGAAYPYPNFSGYAAAKTAVVRLSETVAREVLPFNIQINTIAPGAVETKMLQAVRKAGGTVNTTVSMDLPVNLILFLSSPYSDHITGRFIHSKDNYWDFTREMTENLYTLRRIES